MAKKFKMTDFPVEGGASVAIGRTDGKLVFEIEATTEAPIPIDTGTLAEVLTLEGGYAVTGVFLEVLEVNSVAGSLAVYVDGDTANGHATVNTQTGGKLAGDIVVATAAIKLGGSVAISDGKYRLTVLTTDIV